MKKIIYSLLAIITVTFAALTFTACGDDSDGGGGESNSSTLVGTWSAPHSPYTTTITISNNGTGLWQEFNSSGNVVASGIFSWTQSGNTFYMNWISGDINGAPSSATLSNVTSNSFTCVTHNPTATYNFTKISGGGEGGSSTTGAFQGTKRVFSKALVTEIANSAQTSRMTYDDNGFLTKVEEIKSSGTQTANITYADNKISVVWTRNYGTSKDSPASMLVNIGSNGFASGGEYRSGDGSIETFTFEYNNDNRLSKAKWDGESEVTEFTYTNGDNVISTVYNNSTLKKTYNIGYSSINNTFIVMPEFMGADLDKVGEVLGYAGALGYPTTHLPSSRVSSSGSNYNFEWTVNSSGIPTQLVYSGTTSNIKYIELK